MTIASLAVAVAAATRATTPNGARAASDAGDWSSPGLASSGPAAEYVKTPSGLVYEDVNEGAGEPARAGDVAVFEYVMRRANGYFIYGTVDCGIGCGNGDPFEAKLGPDGNLIAGLDELLTGMKPGAKRKALIKADLGYKDDPKLISIRAAAARVWPTASDYSSERERRTDGVRGEIGEDARERAIAMTWLGVRRRLVAVARVAVRAAIIRRGRARADKASKSLAKKLNNKSYLVSCRPRDRSLERRARDALRLKRITLLHVEQLRLRFI